LPDVPQPDLPQHEAPILGEDAVALGRRFAGMLGGKVALVTGGSRGLGREMVLALAAAGADVVIASRKLDNCERVAEEVRELTGRRALPLAVHMGHWDEQEPLVDRVYEELGRLDVLVNNAGMSPLYDSLDAVSEELYDKVFDVNLKGPFRLSAVAATRMAAGLGEGEGGSIVNISSVAAVQPGVHELPYAAAKLALNQLTVGFAKAYGPKVRVNGILPGPFLTDISKAWDMERMGRSFTRFPLARAGYPIEVVGAALYLATPLSSYTTGALISVDGGMGITEIRAD